METRSVTEVKDERYKAERSGKAVCGLLEK